MAEGVMVIFSNPASPEQEAEYHRWYNDVHIPEVTAPASLGGATRYKVADTQIPGQDVGAHRFMAMYQFNDVETALGDMFANPGRNTPSDASAPGSIQTAVIYEKIYERRKDL